MIGGVYRVLGELGRDAERGLIGTLLNGYDTRFLKKTLRSKPLRPDEAAAAPVGAN